ncbi:hypothetical protein [Allokutzneria multivorans]|uniref:hypothetical protein n=1 Tax=Allokutzneria multivorans TaxID=1142134 RepID=UPI0031F16C36
MEAVLQLVRTSWTKRSRGGEEAARRNAAPVAFALPPSTRAPFAHEVLMDEHDEFSPRSTTREDVSDVGVQLREVDGLLRVELVVSPYGMPKRRRRPPAVRLARGEWLRWQVNYRFASPCSCGGQWSYRMDTFNIAHGTPSAEVFLGEPSRHVSELAALR